MSNHKLGRLPRTFDPRVPKLHDMLAGKSLPPPLASVNYLTGMPAELGEMLNNELGDCTCAAFYHAIQVWSFNANPPMRTWRDRDVCRLYSSSCGYVWGQPSTDQGGIEQVVLAYLVKAGAPIWKRGFGSDKLAAFVEIDVGNIDNVKRCIAEFGIAYIGLNVPNYIIDPENTPAVWDIDPSADNGIAGGHAVVLAGYDAQGCEFISWGAKFTMTWAFFSHFVDEVYALADADWIAAKGTAPCGLTLVQLQAAMQAIRAS